MSAGSAIQEAARAAARPGSGAARATAVILGWEPGRMAAKWEPFEILSDTMGVDFGPYLQRVLHDVRQNWYNAIPESAQLKHGNLIIEFAITKDGKVAGMNLVPPSGDSPLDRAAWAGIVGSDPFPPLPSEFGGQFWRCVSASTTTPPKKNCNRFLRERSTSDSRERVPYHTRQRF